MVMVLKQDMELLRKFAAHRSEDAFATLVERHVNLVHSVAMRYVGNYRQAEEITQAVFLVLARKAGSLSKGTILSGWLFHVARLTAANFRRTEIRRSQRE
jgi:RNA polymerase sigma factor (sigma-70 family)